MQAELAKAKAALEEAKVELARAKAEHFSLDELLKLLEAKIEDTSKTRAALKEIRKAARCPQLQLVANSTADKPTNITTNNGAAVDDEVFRDYRQKSLEDLENQILTI